MTLKKLDRYILRELLVPTFASTLIVAALFAGNEMIALFQQLNSSTVPLLTMLKLSLLRMPYWLTFTFPTGIAMGCSLAMSRLLREGELTAMRASGISIWRILRMVVLTGLALAGGSFYLKDYVVPKTTTEHKKLSAETMLVSGMPNLQSNVMMKIGQYVVTFREMRKVAEDKMALTDVLMVKMGAPGEAAVFFAPNGTYNQGDWNFPLPKVWLFRDTGLVDMHDADSISLNQKIRIEDFVPGAELEDLNRKELWDSIVAAKKAGFPTNKPEVQFYERFAVPAACLVFALASAFLSIRYSKVSAFQGFLLSLVMALVYFNVQVVCSTVVGQNGWLPPMIAVWVPFAIFGVAALIFGRRLE